MLFLILGTSSLPVMVA